MSNINQNVGIIYIQQSGNNIQYQSNSTTGTWIPFTSYPITFINSNPVSKNVLTISLITNLNIVISNGYFITGSNYITYDGTGQTITINNVRNYLGLIQNGTDLTNGFHAITVKNINSAAIGVSNLNGILEIRGGWICQANFGYNIENIPGRVPILIDNCSNSATISTTNGNGIGGIVGGRSFSNGSGIIQNCSNTGAIRGSLAGGIFGMGSSLRGNVIVRIINCSNTGTISGNDAGGICGLQFGYKGTSSVINCSNTGAISGDRSGGICGSSAGSGGKKISIKNCSNTGAISGRQTGGICG